jgi:hypothetical protein
VSTNTCPNPNASQLAELLACIRREAVKIALINNFTDMSHATLYALEGFAEGWELSYRAEHTLRAALLLPINQDDTDFRIFALRTAGHVVDEYDCDTAARSSNWSFENETPAHINRARGVLNESHAMLQIRGVRS